VIRLVSSPSSNDDRKFDGLKIGDHRERSSSAAIDLCKSVTSQSNRIEFRLFARVGVKVAADELSEKEA
jgi:hypothetical protein